MYTETRFFPWQGRARRAEPSLLGSSSEQSPHKWARAGDTCSVGTSGSPGGQGPGCGKQDNGLKTEALALLPGHPPRNPVWETGAWHTPALGVGRGKRFVSNGGRGC